MATWPVTLPSAPSMTSQLASPNCLLRTATTTGPPKIRRLTTAAPTAWSMSWYLTTAQKNTFTTFWQTTIYHGSISFIMTDPESSSSASFRILSWALSREAPNVWKLDATVEKLP